MDKTILIAVDESENSKTALLYVADFLGGFDGFATVVMSVIPIPDDGYFRTEIEKNAWTVKQRETVSAMLERYRQILIQSGFPENKVRTELVIMENNSVARVILEKQEQLDACTLVVGRRGVSRHEEFLFGSVSSKLIHMANKCAVWVVEPVCKTAY